jgi:BASS family bile acid:Na+ symporter
MLAIAAFILAGIGVGHALGGPDEDDRTVLALSTASRHPGVALAIAGAVLPGQRAVTAVILLSLLVGAIVTGPYVKWRKRAAQPIPAPRAH